MLRALSDRFSVTLIGFSYGETLLPPPFPVDVIEIEWQWPSLYRAMHEGDAAATRALTCSQEPWFASILESDRFGDEVARRAAGADLVLVENTGMGRFLHCVSNRITKVLDLQNVHSAMARRHAEGSPAGSRAEAIAEADRTLAFERGVAAACDLCVACSELDAARVRDMLGVERVAVVPNGVDPDYFRPAGDAPTPGALLFTGKMDYAPNAEAAAVFAREILPLIRQRRPETVFHIVGSNPGAEVLALAAPDVQVHGAVPDMRPFYRRAEQVVVPLKQGGGTRLKVLEAAACGKAIVTTSTGAEGLRFVSGRDLVVADAPQEFADAVVALGADQHRRSALEVHARRAALPYAWDTIGQSLCDSLRPLIALGVGRG